MSATQGDLGATRGPGGNEPPAGFLAWWRRRSAMRRAHLEARHLLKEARRILRRSGQQIPGAVATTVRSAIQAVDDAIAAGDVERIRKANATLDEVMDDHLSFARKSTLREYAESIGVAVAVALLLRAFVVEAFQIPSGSMIPTLEVGDHIFVSKFSYGLSIPFTDTKILQYGTPERGDVIVFKFPQDHSTDYIKRVVGLPGDTVEVRQGRALRQRAGRSTASACGCPVTTARCPTPASPTTTTASTGSRRWGTRSTTPSWSRRTRRSISRGTVIAPNEVFVMGDNRDNSYDSRVWGTVNMSLIKGRALIVWWSRGNSKQLGPRLLDASHPLEALLHRRALASLAPRTGALRPRFAPRPTAPVAACSSLSLRALSAAPARLTAAKRALLSSADEARTPHRLRRALWRNPDWASWWHRGRRASAVGRRG